MSNFRNQTIPAEHGTYGQTLSQNWTFEKVRQKEILVESLCYTQSVQYMQMMLVLHTTASGIAQLYYKIIFSMSAWPEDVRASEVVISH